MEYIENVQGKNITIENSNGNNANSVRLLGDTEQNSYSGKNLLQNNLNYQTGNGITFTKNDDGTVLVNGTATDLAIVNINTNVSLPAGTYILNGCPSGGSVDTYRLDINNGSTIRDYGSGYTFTLNETTTLTNVRIRIASGTVVNNLVFKPMIRQSTVTDASYEPYVGGIPSPNPDYPQEVKTVKGITNLYDYGFRNASMGITCSNCNVVEENGIFTMTTTGGDAYMWQVIAQNSNYSNAAGQLFEFEEDSYMLSISDSTLTRNYITYYDNDKKSLGYVNKSDNHILIRKSDKVGAKYFSIRIGQPTYLPVGTVHTFTVQLTKGNMLYDYIQYGKHINYVKSAGKNLLDTSKIHLPNLNGLNAKLDNAKLTLNGNNTAQGYIISNNSNTSVVIDEGTYRFSIKILGGSSNITDSMPGNIAFNIKKYTDFNTILGGVDLKSALRSQTGVNVTSFTVTSPTVIGVEAYTNATTFIYDNLEIGIQLEKSDEVTEWEPYIGKTYQIDVSKKNLFDKTNIVEKTTLNSSGTIISDNNSNVYYIPVESGKKYVMHQGYTRQYVYSFFTNIPTLGSTGTPRTVISSAKDVIVTVPSGYDYLVFRDYTTSSIENNETLIVTEGTEIYNELCKIGDYQDSFIKGTGKSLFGGFTYTNTVHGMTFTYNKDGSITVDGTSDGSCYSMGSAIARNNDYLVNLEPGTYSIGTGLSNIFITVCKSDGNVIVNTSAANPTKQFTINETTDVFIRLQINSSGVSVSNQIIYTMLEKNSVSTEWEPYGAKDKWLLHKEIGKYNIDSSTVKSTTINSGTYMIYGTDVLIDAPSINDTANVICSHLSGKLIWQSVNEGIYTNKNNLYFTLKGERFGSTASSLNTYLDNLGMYVYYPLAMPTNILLTNTDLIKQLDELNNMELPYGTVNIDSYGDLPAILDINYNNWNKDINPSDRAALLDGTATIETEIEVINEENDNIILTQDNSVISWNHEDFRYVKNEGFIGQFVARQLTGELKDLDDDFNITDKELHLKLGVRTNNNTNWYSLGNFLTTKITNDEVKDKTSFEALDYTKKFNKKYEDTITYPCTARDLALNVCEQCGVELATPIFKNHDYVIEGNVFKNNETCRDVMKAIGKLAFSWVRVDWDDKIYLDFTKEIVQRNYDSANNSQYYNLKTQKEKFGPVNRIVIGYSQIDGERTFIDDTESISENGECELTVYDNPLVYNAEQRAMIIESARELMGLEYTPLNTLTIGHPWLKGKELFNIVDMEGNTHKTIPFDRTIQYFGHIKTLIDVNTATKTENSLAYKPDIEKGLMETEIQVNKNTGDITSLTRRTENVEDGLGNTYTIEQTNQLIQNASTGITNTFSEAGGNNVFRNTGLWFEQSDSVTKTGKNLFNSTDGENGWINSEGIITAANENYCSDYIPLKTGITYTISMNVTDLTQTNIGISIFDSEKTYVSRTNNRYVNSVTFTAENDGYIRFWVQVSNTTGLNATNVASTYNVQMEKGSTPTSYEPYYEYTNDYEFWDGPVVKQKEENAANLNALLLQLGTLSQEQLVPNGNYTISFKYKKLINLANVKCIINDIEHQLTGTNETEFMQVIEVSSQHINVKFKTDIDNSCEIYDLMVNAGSVKLAYSQNQNETTTDTVNISKGITITSSDTDTIFKANADGIRTLDKNGNVKTRFTDTGMTTKEQIVEEKAEIVGVLIQQVGDQTWFTRL